MEATRQESAEEIKRLRRCLNDLVSVIALPAIWSGGEASDIYRTLLETLLRMLSLDFVYAHLNEMEEEPKKFIKVAESFKIKGESLKINELIEPWLGKSPQAGSFFAKRPIGGGTISIISLPLGLHGEFGLLVAGAERPEFPEQSEKLVMDVAANQAVIGLQEARLLKQQRRIASELDELVAHRTIELELANETLKKEMAERRRTEDSLRDSEHKSRQIMETIPGMVGLLTATGEIEVLNRQLLEYFGQTTEELKNWGTNGTIHSEDVSQVIENFSRAIMLGKPYEIVQRFRRFDGVYRWFQNSGFPLCDADGQIIRWCVLLTDIDERKHAEDALRRSERNLKLIIDTIPALAWSARPDGSAEFFSQRYLDYIGISPEEAADWGWMKTVHSEDINGLVTTWQSIIARGEPGEIEARMRRYDGEYRWFLFRTNPLHDEFGSIVKWYGTNTDIDDLKRVEDALRRSEAFLAEGQHLARTGNFSWRVATNEIMWSEQLYRIFELESGTPILLKLLASRLHPEDLPLMQDMIERAKRGVSNFEYEPRLLMPDGSIKYLHLIAHRIRDHRGQMEYIGAVQDVTQRRLSEEALGKARSELARVARAMSLGVLTASITHEVNQPLSGIITNASTCLRMLDAEPPNIDGARETARRTIRDSNRATDVIKRLRALFGKKDFTLEPVDLNEAAQEVIALSRNELQRSRVVLKTELAKDLPPVAGDRIQLQQVILNLLLNGIDAMNSVDDRPRKLTIITELEESNWTRLSVFDEGIGFVSDTVEKLFEAFYTTKTSGMGIGLSVSRSIIEKHQGRLWAEPNEGQGAVFSFSIPVLAVPGDERDGEKVVAVVPNKL